MTILAIIVLAMFAVLVAGPIVIAALHDGRSWLSYSDAVKSSALVLAFLACAFGCLAAVSWAVRTLKGEA